MQNTEIIQLVNEILKKRDVLVPHVLGHDLKKSFFSTSIYIQT